MHALERRRNSATTPPGLTLPAERTGAPQPLSAEPVAARDPHQALQLVVEARCGALIRLLGLVERRGHQVTRAKVELGPQGVMQVNLSVRSERSVELLARQLMRLVEVRTVERLP